MMAASKKSEQDDTVKVLDTKPEVTISDLYDLIKSNKTSNDDFFHDIQMKFNYLNDNLDMFKAAYEALSAELARVKNANTALEADIESLNCLLKSNAHDEHQGLPRDKNILIFNVPEKYNEERWETISIGINILKFLNASDEAMAISRIGSFNKYRLKPRPILVECKSITSVLTILKEKKRLRQSGEWKKVFIEPQDTTVTQRNVMKNIWS